MKSNNYNFIAPYYDLITKLVFFGSIQKAQIAHLNDLPDKGRILFIGGGTGFALRRILQLKPNLTIDYVDQSKKMIELSKKKIKSLPSSNVNFINGNESSIPKENYDGIISFFYFDILPKTKREMIFETLFHQLKTGGILLFADFNQANTAYEKLLEFGMFRFLKLSTNSSTEKIPNFHSLLDEQKLKPIAKKSFYNKFIFSNAYLKLNWNKS